MIFAVSRWLVRIGVLIALAVVAALTWLLTFESGTRFLLARVEPYFPDALRIEAVSGTLVTGLAAGSVEWRGNTVSVFAVDASIDVNLFELWALNVGIDSLRLNSLVIRLSEPAEAAVGEPYAGFVTPIPIAVADAEIANFELDVRGRSFPARDLQLSARLRDSRVDGRLYVQSELVSGNVTGGISLSPPYDFDWLLERADVRVGEQFQSTVASLHIDGNPREFESTADLDVSLLDWPALAVSFSGNGDFLSIDLAAMDIASEAGTASANGQVRWLPEISWDVDFETEGLNLSRFVAGIDAVIDSAGRASGQWTDSQVVDGRLGLRTVSGTYASHAVEGSGNATLNGRRIELADVELTSGQTQLFVDGQVAEALNLEVGIESDDISDFLADGSGAVSAKVTVQGNPRMPEVAGNLEARGFSWSVIAAEAAELEFAYRAGGDVSIDLRGSRVQVSGQPIDEATVSARGSLASHRIDIDLAGRGATASVTATGGLANSAWTGALEEAVVDGDLLGAWTLRRPAPVEISADASRLGEACLDRRDGDGLACVDVAVLRDSDNRFALSLANFPLEALSLPIPESVASTGQIFLDINGDLDESGIDGSISLDVRGASLKTLLEGEEETISFETFSGRGTIASNVFSSRLDIMFGDGFGSASVDLQLQDLLNPATPVSGSSTVNINDISVITVLIPSINNAMGEVAGTLDIAGTLDAPRLTGKLDVRNGAFDVPTAGIEVRELELTLAQENIGSLTINGSAKSGDGDVTIVGKTTLDSESGIATDVFIHGERFEIVRLPDLNVAASPDVRIIVDDDRIYTVGSVGIPLADIDIKTVPTTAQRPSRDAVVYGRDDRNRGSRKTVMDVNVTLGDDVHLSGFGLETDLTGSLRIQRTPQTPLTGNGRIALQDGRFEAYGQDLEVENGELFFSGPLDNPLFDVRAVRTLPEVTAGIHVTGNPGRLTSELFSDPDMSEAEALSYLLTGRPLNIANTGDGDLLNQAAFALGMSQAGAITSQVRSSLGLETLTVEGGLDDSRIIAGKRIGGRLLVEYGYGLVDQLGTLILKYQVNERLTLESSTGSVSTVDLIYNVRRK